jgi:pimeloyl-ACP methyl ester carboxylesterase
MKALAELTTRAGSLVDGAVLRVMNRLSAAQHRRERPAGALRELLAELAELYGHDRHFLEPDRFFVPPPRAQVTATHRGDRPGGGAVVDLRWASAHVPLLSDFRGEWTSYAANQTAHARWFRAARPRPVAVLFHGWGGGNFAFEARAFPVEYFGRLGLDVILFTLPFHGLRTPAGTRSGQLFPSSHVVRSNEAFAQTVSDFRALREWLLDRDVPGLGVAGMSLGGYTTALLAALVPDLRFAIPMIPAVSMSELMWRHGEGSEARKRALAEGVSQLHLDEVFRVHAPLARPPLVAPERRFIIAARGDRITPPDQAERLWRHWERPPIHWFPGGHLAQVGRSDAFRAMGRWLRGLI